MSMNFRLPIFFGDTIRVKTTVTHKRPTSKPNLGIMVQKVELINQRGEVVQDGEDRVMLHCRP
ncbi:MAG: hypothetical protein SCK28_02390 [Bacillota bacterium]|nr:hypothetical protein [Bacillota bacterium]